jgi:hypothetical protein
MQKSRFGKIQFESQLVKEAEARLDELKKQGWILSDSPTIGEIADDVAPIVEKPRTMLYREYPN